MIKRKLLQTNLPSVSEAAAAITRSVSSFEHLEATRFRHDNGSCSILIRNKSNPALQWLAMDQQIHIQLDAVDENRILLSISTQIRRKWMILLLSLFILWPLGFCALAGIVLQAVQRALLLHPITDCLNTRGETT